MVFRWNCKPPIQLRWALMSLEAAPIEYVSPCLCMEVFSMLYGCFSGLFIVLFDGPLLDPYGFVVHLLQCLWLPLSLILVYHMIWSFGRYARGVPLYREVYKLTVCNSLLNCPKGGFFFSLSLNFEWFLFFFSAPGLLYYSNTFGDLCDIQFSVVCISFIPSPVVNFFIGDPNVYWLNM